MATRLHIGNLPYSVSEEELRQLFSQVGEVQSIELLTDRFTGRPRGFGYIEMTNPTEAEEAIQRFNGYTLENRPLRVEMAREREPRSSGGGRGSESGGYSRHE